MSNIDIQIDRLQKELQLEKSRRDALKISFYQSECDLNVLQNTLVVGDYDCSNNNWKQKYEKQYEKNTYLEHELLLMKEKLEVLSKVNDEAATTYKKEDQPDLDLRFLLRQLEHDKCVLEGTVNDSYWRLDSEAKKLFNLGEKKREYMLNINQSHSAPLLNKKTHNDWMKTRYQGIPDNQRIIDPRKGPIKKNACRVNLPKITTTEVNAVLSENKKHKYTKMSISKEKLNTDPEISKKMGKHFQDNIKTNEKIIINKKENTVDI